MKKLDKETLERLYHDEQMTQGEIGQMYGVSNVTIGNWMRRHGISVRNVKDAQRAVTLDKKTLYDLYIEQEMSSVEIASLYDGLDSHRVLRLLKRNGIQIRPQWQACAGWNTGVPVSKERRRRQSEIMRERFANGATPHNLGVAMSDEQKKKISESLKGRFRGKKHPRWIDDKKYRRWRELWYNRFEYKEWRSFVFARDNYTCQMCGKPSNGDIEAHHIKPADKYPKLIVDKDNGITLCVDCHRSIKGKEEQYEKQFSECIASLSIQ